MSDDLAQVDDTNPEGEVGSEAWWGSRLNRKIGKGSKRRPGRAGPEQEAREQRICEGFRAGRRVPEMAAEEGISRAWAYVILKRNHLTQPWHDEFGDLNERVDQVERDHKVLRREFGRVIERLARIEGKGGGG